MTAIHSISQWLLLAGFVFWLLFYFLVAATATVLREINIELEPPQEIFIIQSIIHKSNRRPQHSILTYLPLTFLVGRLSQMPLLNSTLTSLHLTFLLEPLHPSQ